MMHIVTHIYSIDDIQTPNCLVAHGGMDFELLSLADRREYIGLNSIMGRLKVHNIC